MYSTKSWALIWLTVIWVAVRIYPAVMGWSSLAACGEVVAGRKLLEVGIQRLQGAQLRPVALYGTVAHPEHYVVCHGAYPTIWTYTALYYFFGFGGVSAVIYLLKYAVLLLCFLVLDRCFSRSAAFWATALYAVAPLFILCDGASNTIILSTIFWPIGVALIVFRLHRRETTSAGDLWLAGATTFVAGQSCYAAFTIVPALMVIGSRLTSLRPRAIRAVATNPVSLAFLAGGVLSFLLMLGQIAFYEGGLGLITKYALNKAGASVTAGQRLYVLALLPVRISFFAGFALTFASLLGCLYLAKDRALANKQPVMGVVSYFIVYGTLLLMAPAGFVEENHYFAWLIFPGAVMAAMLFDNAGSQLRRLILALGVFGIVVALVYASVPVAGSPTSRYLGKVFAEQSKKTDFIFTNIKPPGPPYRPSDVGGDQSTRLFADRFITFGVSDPAQLSVAQDLVDAATRFQYWRLRSLPIGSALEAELVSKGRLLKTLPLTFPVTTEKLAEKLRAFVWYSVMKKGKRPVRDSNGSSDYIDIYEIDLPDAQ